MLLVDLGNILFWCFNCRWFEVEVVCDVVFSVSGRFNIEKFGLLIFLSFLGFIEEVVKWDKSKWDI